MWFNKNDITLKQEELIDVPDIRGYVLPHASTKFTGHIISHTLRFRPKKFDTIIIIYYPATQEKTVNGKYFHEYYVVSESIKYVCNKLWKYNIKRIIGINLRDSNHSVKLKKYMNSKTLFVVSADFSHQLLFKQAMELEDCAAKGLLNRFRFINCYKVVDDIESFKLLFKIIPKDWYLQWVGRTRSPGERAVGYLSFLIREKALPQKHLPDSMFVTAYDNKMNARECLGEYYSNTNIWTKQKELNLIKKVIEKGRTNSRLTLGENLHIPVNKYIVTYLYKDKTNSKFIRGWHGILYNAFYLPNVMLENTFDNGIWIRKKTDSTGLAHIKWMPGNQFDITHTLNKLNIKAMGVQRNNKPQFYYVKQRSGNFKKQLSTTAPKRKGLELR